MIVHFGLLLCSFKLDLENEKIFHGKLYQDEWLGLLECILVNGYNATLSDSAQSLSIHKLFNTAKKDALWFFVGQK